MTTNLPRLELPSSELAHWLDGQDPGVWWLVDGDPLLTGNLSFPCPSDVLADELRKIDQPLLLIPPKDTVPGDRSISSNELDHLVQREPDRDERMFVLRWAQSPSGDDWLLIEDKDSAKWAQGVDEEMS
jgi:hypothetical protein